MLLTSLYVLFRSDPTENDSVEGLTPNARGSGLVSFGVFYLLVCYMNEVDLIFMFLVNNVD